ncbi:sialidase family protein [Aureivirga sp. CE67]|uniref:sialidase family protein n=1 Tax=Aureivirga sp. CE67 TaxID=1788983 RepID=UPI0018C99400|nr:sialidase family protein [Aureivirga sp. CE67]
MFRKTILITIFSLLIISCTEKKKSVVKTSDFEVKVLEKEIISKNKYNASGPYFSKKGSEITLNWSEEIDSNYTTILKYKNINQPKIKTVLPSKGMQSHGESMAKIIQDTFGNTIAIFRIKAATKKNKYGGFIYYSISKDQGETWTEKQKLVKDETSGSQSFYDVALLGSGNVGIIWLDNRKPKEIKQGSSLYFAKTNQNGEFTNEKVLSTGTCQCCRTDLFVNKNGKIDIAFRNIVAEKYRDIYNITSEDHGENFSVAKRISPDNWKLKGCPHTGPSIAFNGKTTGIIWYTAADGKQGVNFVEKVNESFDFSQSNLLTSIAKHPQMIADNFGNYFATYEEITEDGQQRIVLHIIYNNGKMEIIPISDAKGLNRYPVITKKTDKDLMIAWIKDFEEVSKIIKVDVELR